MALKHFMLMILLWGTTWAQTDTSNKELTNALNNLPPELQQNLNETDIENIKNKSQQIFKEKCEKNGGTEAYEAAQKAYESFPDCVKNSLGLSDPSVLQQEIDEARPRGAVDEVFKKYCAKSPQVKECLRSMADTVKPCFSADEHKNLKTVYNITEQLAEFICFKDGDRIALFIAEGGPECFNEKQEDIKTCVNNTFGYDYQLNSDNMTFNAIPEINFGEKECAKLSELEKCVVAKLEDCKAPTSANIVESLFKFARSATPCKAETVKKNKGNSASSLAVTSATLIMTIAVTLT